MLILRVPSAADEAVLRLAHRELESDGHPGFLLHGYTGDESDFREYLLNLEKFSAGRELPEAMVQDDFLIAEVEGEIIGRISIRHTLNDFLFNYGGHIGYMVRPAFRRRGYASEMLRQALLVAKELGIDAVLLTCNDDNLGSIKVIEKHGGQLEDKVDENGKLLRRYWINNSKGETRSGNNRNTFER
jgi:predicted acetyltransferase